MNSRSLIATLAVCATALTMTALVSPAGELNPPTGAITETGRFGPRIEVNSVNTPGSTTSTFVISQPGSYYLAGNLSGQNAKHGIEITSSGVTLDLMGFEMKGLTPPPGLAGESLDGITGAIGIANVHIRNGSLRNWGGDGVDLAFTPNCSLRNLRTWNNATDGMRVGRTSIVEGCSAHSNGNWGIFADSGSTVSRNAAQGNGSHGIRVGQGSTVIGNAARANGGDGISGSSRCTISENAVSLNSLDGIEVSQDCLVIHNTCGGNGNGAGNGAGIHASSNRNRIEANVVNFNDKGIEVDVSGNLIICNSASANTVAYDIAVNNRYGPIIDISAFGTAAVLGGSAPSTLTTTDPWANFTH